MGGGVRHHKLASRAESTRGGESRPGLSAAYPPARHAEHSMHWPAGQILSLPGPSSPPPPGILQPWPPAHLSRSAVTQPAQTGEVPKPVR